MSAYGISTPNDVALFFGALGILRRLGGIWSNTAATAQNLDNSGLINIDPNDSDIQNGALGVTDAPASGWIGSRRIRLNPTLMVGGNMTRPIGGMVLSSKAFLVAAILAHEIYHWQNGSSEPPAWKFEINFWKDLYLFESRQHGVTSPRTKEVYINARGREHEGFMSGYLSGPKQFP